jgi:hypothetical protein
LTRCAGALIWPIALALALNLALAGCAGPSENSAPSASTPNGPDPATIRYSCVGPPGFLPTLFDKPGTAELEDHPSAAALRVFLAEDSFGLGYLPDAGYWLVHRDDRGAHYLARLAVENEFPFGYLTMQATGANWAFAGGGDCRPAVLLEDLMPATWTLPPNQPAPDRSTVEFTALVTDTGCTGGEPAGPRLLPPSITYTDNAVLIVFTARPFQGITTCQGKPATAAVVRLREQLGDRRLLDAGVFPPADPVAPGF